MLKESRIKTSFFLIALHFQSFFLLLCSCHFQCFSHFLSDVRRTKKQSAEHRAKTCHGGGEWGVEQFHSTGDRRAVSTGTLVVRKVKLTIGKKRKDYKKCNLDDTSFILPVSEIISTSPCSLTNVQSFGRSSYFLRSS